MQLLHRLALATAFSSLAVPAWSATTQATGSGEAFANYQPSLALSELIAFEGIYPADSSGGLGDGAGYYTIGMIRNFAGNYQPGGGAEGGAVAISTQGPLYSIIGKTYGGGVGYFNVPDLRRTTIVGASSPSGQAAVSGYLIGQKTGSEGTTLTIDQLPGHSHSLPGGGTTDQTGAGMAFDQRQPSLSMTYLIAAGGAYPGSGTAVSIGQVAAFAGSFVPRGWRPADGALLSIADYSSLYSIIGTTYGGDGITTFALPDLIGRTVVGAGAGAGLRPVALGEIFGSDMTTLTGAQLAAHDHGLDLGGVTGSTGLNASVDEYQASIGLNYIISLQGVFPTREDPLDPENQSYGEIVAWAGSTAPRGWAFADGSLLRVSQNQALYSILGTYYGGDGSQYFALPDLRGRTIVGTGLGLTIGTQLGTGSSVLSAANLPTHSHEYTLAGTVPEPATWGLMIAGFGLVGTSLRRSRGTNIVAA